MESLLPSRPSCSAPRKEDLMIWISFVNSLHDDTKFQQQNNSTFFFSHRSYLEVVRKGTLSVVSLFSFLLYFNPNATSFYFLLLLLFHHFAAASTVCCGASLFSCRFEHGTTRGRQEIKSVATTNTRMCLG